MAAFHFESAMIHNLTMPAYRYDSYSRRLTREVYDHTALANDRDDTMREAASARRWRLMLCSLDRRTFSKQVWACNGHMNPFSLQREL
ncbi:hypothetical protein K470DRAFT_260918 [Piedraia hortae CBS 480.64]|uniref:Uncharacterized protein n=1 Tax=Piedraia hortae CBS 480.64 TaxID=1314780 RepID=A0A6A7BPZ4_9PEZI|nr:hypothetical protein K470DRAFT_260918 [Piedraia hortae CBS 480.64]